MKICLFVGDYLDSNNGIAQYTKNLVNKVTLLDRNIKLKVIPKSNHNYTKKKKTYLPYSLLGFRQLVIKLLNPFIIEWMYFNKFRRNKFGYFSLIKRVNADLYHAVSPSEALVLVDLKRRPLITTIHDIIPLVSENRFVFEKFYFKRYINAARMSDIIIADSYNTKNDLIKILNFSADKIIVVYPAIDLQKFYPVNKLNSPIKTILYHGGLIKRKGVYRVLSAFNLLLKNRNNIRLIFSGGGEEAQGLKSMAKRMGISENVIFLGHISEEEVVKIYHMADVFAYPSAYEGFGYTPLEAMACGVPVVTSNASSIPEVVGDAAILIDPNNDKEICDAISRVLDDDKLRNKMVEKGIIQANKFGIQRFSENILKIYRSFQ